VRTACPRCPLMNRKWQPETVLTWFFSFWEDPWVLFKTVMRRVLVVEPETYDRELAPTTAVEQELFRLSMILLSIFVLRWQLYSGADYAATIIKAHARRTPFTTSAKFVHDKSVPKLIHRSGTAMADNGSGGRAVNAKR
jgi:hypothetical protein